MTTPILRISCPEVMALVKLSVCACCSSRNKCQAYLKYKEPKLI